jgi:hypothetical protein
VEDLKKEIKKNNENSLALIDVRTLKLWKVGESSLRGSMTSDFREAISTDSFCGNPHEG